MPLTKPSLIINVYDVSVFPPCVTFTVAAPAALSSATLLPLGADRIHCMTCYPHIKAPPDADF